MAVNLNAVPADSKRGYEAGNPRRAILFLLIVALSVGLTGTALSQTYSSYSDFAIMSQAELACVQIKITSLFMIRRATPSILIVPPGKIPNITQFQPFRRSGYGYGNDTYVIDGVLYPTVVEVYTTEIENIIDIVGTLPDITSGSIDSVGYTSFAILYSGVDTTLCFEKIVNKLNGRELFAVLREALQNNQYAILQLIRFACFTNLLQDFVATDFTENVDIAMSGLRLDSTSDPSPQFVGTIKLTNKTGATLLPPVSLILATRNPSVRLIHPDGYTCKLLPFSSPYINLPVGAGLANNQSVEITVRFYNPNMVKIDLRWRWKGKTTEFFPRVIAGPGER
jgi:hypothetical protein